MKALGTNDPEDAKRRVMQTWQRYFDTLRDPSPLTEEDKIDLVAAHYFSTLERDGQNAPPPQKMQRLTPRWNTSLSECGARGST